MDTRVHKHTNLSAEALFVIEPAPKLVFLPIEGISSHCSMLWCLHTHAMLKMALSRTKMVLLAHLF